MVLTSFVFSSSGGFVFKQFFPTRHVLFFDLWTGKRFVAVFQVELDFSGFVLVPVFGKIHIKVKVQGRNYVMRTQCLFNGGPNHAVNGPFILELDFRFGRMDVDIDMGRIDVEKENIKRMLVWGYQRFIGIGYRMVQVIASYITVIYEKELIPPAFFSLLRLADISLDGYMGGLFTACNQLTLIAFSEYSQNPVTEFAGG